MSADALPAWLLPVADGVGVLLPHGTLAEYLAVPRRHAVPGAPPVCRRLVVWRGAALPVLDVGALLGAAAPANDAVVVRYVVRASGRVAHAAFAVQGSPVRVHVTDGDAGELPAELAALRPYVLACVRIGATVAPVLEVEALLGASPGAAPVDAPADAVPVPPALSDGTGD